MPEAFAVVREASKRVLNMRHFDVQLIGGMVLHNGKIAEMRTGEGKTLMATLPVYLNALAGKGVHLVTVNDYLAKRDAEWMGRIYQFLGISVGVILSQMDHGEKQAAYAAEITYGTNNEFGFDYLRDNMVNHPAERVQRVLNYAIVDEVDSILIDEARTPLIISGQAEGNTDVYVRMNALIPKLVRQENEKSAGDFSVDEKAQQVLLSEAGFEHAEKLLAQSWPALTWNQSLRPRKHQPRPSSLRGAARARLVPSRSALCSTEWRSGDRGRVYRDGSCPEGAGPKACIRPWKPKKGFRSRKKIRHSPRSLFRIIFACIKSWRV